MATSFQYDVFLSHSSVDKAAVLELAERLKGDGLRVWLDVWVIQPGDQISVMVDRGLAASRRIVLVMSAAALNSEWVTREFHTIVYRDPINRQRRLIPLLLDDCDVPDGVSPFARIDWRTRSDAEYNRLLDICRSPIPEVEGETSQDNREPARPPIVRRRVPTPTGPSSALAPLELPPAAAKYFGRGEQVKWLAERLKAGQNSAVVGAAGMGKTALAAEAVSEAVGTAKESLPYSPFPDGVFFLDLYAMHAVADEAWNALANKVAGADFLEDKPARVRAVEACRGRRLLLIVEGAESADGAEGRAELAGLLAVLSPENRQLVLTRDIGQVDPADTIQLTDALPPDDARDLLDSLTKGRLTAEVRGEVLGLLQGHPLALTWAGNLIARDDDTPESLVKDWKAEALPSLTDPKQAKRTLRWLFDRSARGLDETANRVLSAAGLLAHAPFPIAAIEAALSDQDRAGKAARNALRSLTQRSLLRHMEGDLWQFSHVLAYGFARKEKGSDSAMRLRLANWLRTSLERSLASAADRATLIRALEHVAALLRADDDQCLWTALGEPALYDIANRLEEMGQLALMKTALSAVAGWLDIVPSHEAIAPKWQRERCTLLAQQGDLLRAQGDVTGALAVYRQVLLVVQRLAQSDPSNSDRQHDLSVAQIKVGDMFISLGDIEGAFIAYGDALAVRRKFLEADPSSELFRREVGAIQDRVGNVLRKKGDLSGALAAYREAMAVAHRLLESNPSNVSWRRDLSISQINSGEVLREQGDLDGALAAFREATAVRRQLAESDPSNASWQRDLNYSLNQIAAIFEKQGDRSQASTLAQESLKIIERLAELDPTNAIWQKDLVFTRALVARLRQQS